MPIYAYQCPECQAVEEVSLPIAERDNIRRHCNSSMVRLMTIPFPPIMKKTGRGMALDTLNSRETNFMKPKYKEWAARGI